MAEKGLISGTEIIQAGLSVRRVYEAVARTLPVARKSYFAFAAVPRKGIALRVAEGTLPVRRHQLQKVLLLDVPQPEPGFDKVIAGVEIAVVLQSQGVAAGFGKDAQRGGQFQQGRKSRFEQLDKDKDVADVARDPLVKNADSTMGMNCMNCVLTSSRKNRYTTAWLTLAS